MALMPRNYNMHDFYCLNCGNRNYTLCRPRSKNKGPNHRKALYCPSCKLTINHIEARDAEEAFDFKIAFENNEFIEEAKESIKFLKESAKYE